MSLGPVAAPGSSWGRAAGGRAGALMAGAAVRESATFAGRPDQVREARAFVFRLARPVAPVR